MISVLAYLAAIVMANLSVAYLGPGAVILNAVVLIGLDLTLRDRLHDAWEGQGLVWKMALLIAAGGALSYIVNRDAGQIAVASTVAFGLAAIADAAVYAILDRRTWMVRANGSNIAGAAVDSAVFPTLAFGGFDPVITVGLFAAKVFGGYIWSLVLDIPLRPSPR